MKLAAIIWSLALGHCLAAPFELLTTHGLTPLVITNAP
jgi:hypothetical protein